MTPKRKRDGSQPPPPPPTRTAAETHAEGAARRHRNAVDRNHPPVVGVLYDAPHVDLDEGSLNRRAEHVEQAMRRLQEMEAQLQSHVKRQQLEVEASKLSCELSDRKRDDPRRHPRAHPPRSPRRPPDAEYIERTANSRTVSDVAAEQGRTENQPAMIGRSRP